MMLTPEQIERRSQETDVELFVERLTICREAIVRRHPDPPKTPISDFIDCPICQDGQLRYTVGTHGRTHHIRARCSEGCVEWME